MSDRRCCCVSGDCLILGDGFLREDSTDFGADWEEVAGDWEIDDYSAVISGTADALLIAVPQNTQSGRAVVYVSITSAGVGETFRVIVNYEDDENYKYVEFETQVATLTIRPRIIDEGVEAGTIERTYGSADGWDYSASDIGLTVFFDEGFLFGELRHAGFVGCVWEISVTTNDSGRRAGLGTGGTAEHIFDSFSYYMHYLDDSACPDKGCYCASDGGNRYYLPWQLRLDYYADAPPDPGCLCFDGGWADLEYDCELERWVAVDGEICGVGLPTEEYNTAIVCGYDVTADWMLDQPACPVQDYPATSFQCYTTGNPLEIRWDWEVPASDFSCCSQQEGQSYYAIATAA